MCISELDRIGIVLRLDQEPKMNLDSPNINIILLF